ncbi:MAG: CopG family transcriptional regulator [Nitrospirae bacterium]|nr:CopG family transcriptional regulator [Nitrospirota bacterium]
MKTAISVPDEIFKKADEAAKEYNYSRSELFTLAVKEFLEKIKSKRLLEAINDAYSEPETSEETSLREKGKKYYSRKVLKRRY